jgi:Receptor L domain
MSFDKQWSMLAMTAALGLSLSACAVSGTRSAERALPSLECPGGSVSSEDEAAAFRGCEVVTGDLRITASTLSDLGAFAQLRSVTGRLAIEGNPQLYRVVGLSRLTQVGELRVDGNPRLNSLSGLQSLERARVVEIRNNPRLCARGMLPDLAHVEQVTLHQNRGLSRSDVTRFVERVGLEKVTPEGSVAQRQAAL